jgi:hypothetical protein
VMERLVLSDAAWERIAPLIIGRPDQKGSTGRDNRMFVEGAAQHRARLPREKTAYLKAAQYFVHAAVRSKSGNISNICRNLSA